MYHLKESIEINAPPEKVFQFLSDIKSRLELAPSYRLLDFQPLTPGPVRKKSRFKVVIEAEGKTVEYISEVSKFKPNKLIVLKRLDGGLTVSLKLKKTPSGTLLTHEEKFKLQTKPGDLPEDKRSLLKVITIAIFDVPFQNLHEQKEEGPTEKILKDLQDKLKIWLQRIKETVEAKNG